MDAIRAARLLFVIAGVTLVFAARAGAQPSVATVHLTPGWASFGQAVPQGVARDGLQVGALPTQTDVRNRWPDGSIRFAVLTVKAPAAGRYVVTAGAAARGSFSPVVPAAAVTLVLDGVPYTAALPPEGGREVWLSGPLASERRATLAPIAPGGQAHPFLRVNFDTRLYRDGRSRVDVSVENMLDAAGAATIDYDAAVAINGATVFLERAVTHHYLTRWRKVFDVGAPAATVTPDLAAFVETHALPPYLASITGAVPPGTGARYGILREGAFARDLRAEDVAPLPHWAARYLVHKTPRLRAFVLANGDLSGSWPVHVREEAGSPLPGIGAERLLATDHRSFRHLKGDALTRPSPLVPDTAHQPSIAFLPYLLTGDRYYAEEMAFWASYAVQRQDALGSGWALRNLADAAAFYPDASPVKAYLVEQVQRHLALLDARDRSADGPDVSVAQNALAYAIDRAGKLGFTGGLAERDAIVRRQLALVHHHRAPSSGPAAAAARVSLIIGAEHGWDGAAAALASLAVPDLAERAGWAIASPLGEPGAAPAQGAMREMAASSAAAIGHAAHHHGAAAGPDLRAAAAAATALPHNIPDFSNDPARATVRSVRSGSWSAAATWSAGRAPTANEVVHVDPGHTVTIDDTSAVGYTVAVHGTLRFNPAANTRLNVTNLMVMGDHGMPTMTTDGHLEVGTAAAPIAAHVTAEIVIRNRPIGDSVADPEQFGTGLLGMGRITMHGAAKNPTFVRAAVEPRAGHTTVTLESPVSGWRAGDRIFLPDTRQVPADQWFNAGYALQVEERTIQSISGDGRTITLSSPLTYDHRGARDADGTPTVLPNGIKLLPHVGNLTRNIVIRSENPAGTRGHTVYTHRAAVAIAYVQFQDLGRTRAAALHGSTNKIGRYPLHVHHLWGPENAANTGYQFSLVGNAVNDSLKWPIAIHGSHYGLISQNVVFGGAQLTGAGIAIEDGTETENLFERNYVANIRGNTHPRQSGPNTADGTTPGSAAECYWAAGFNNRFVGNVAATCRNTVQEIVSGPGWKLIVPPGPYTARNPRFRGADMNDTAQTISVTPQHQAVIEFRDNEVYGIAAGGLTFWNLGTDGYGIMPASMPETVVKDFRVWHTYESAVYHYPANKVTYDGLVYRMDAGATQYWQPAVQCGDYRLVQMNIRNANVHAGGLFGNCTDPLGTMYLEHNRVTARGPAFEFETPATPGTGASRPTSGVTFILRGNVVSAWPGTSLRTIAMDHNTSKANNQPQDIYEVFVYDHQGAAGNNFRAYFGVQASQNLYGGVAPCSNTTARPDVSGITCNIGGTPAPPTVSIGASPAAISSGGSATLSWTSSNATSVTIDNGIGTVAANGSRSVSPATTTTYTITATNSAGSATDTVTVTVNSPPPTPTVTLSASPSTIAAGESATLTWTSTNASSVTIDNGIGAVAANGSRTVSPGATTTYTITAANASGSANATATVTVSAPPPPPPPPAADFTLTATPGTRSVTPGASTTYTVTIGAVNGFAGAVNLSVTGLPAHAPASFSPASLTGAGTATLTVTTGVLTPFGTSTLTVRGTSGSLSHTDTVQLQVKLPVLSVNFAVDAGDTMTASQKAGVVRRGNWNTAIGAASASPLALEDENGVSTAARLTWSSDNVWETPITGTNGNQRMMQGYLDNGFGGTVTVAVSGLPHGTYDVYVYVDGDNGANRTGAYRISGSGITPATVSVTDLANTHFDGTFVQAANSSGNYVKFTFTGTGFTITATPGASDDHNRRAPVNGLQIVPA